MPLERLQKILARAGYGSRRGAESLITEGRVTVDDVVVTQLGSKADPDTQKIAVDLQPIKLESKVYLLLNKPKGMICSNVDPAGRPLAVELPGVKERIFSVGRLDEETTGLLLLTNDGEWANLLAHPRYKIEKTYQARVVGEISNEALAKLRSGVHLSDGKTAPAWVEFVKHGTKVSQLTVTIREGMNRQVRRMLAAVGLKCIDLRRVAIGPLHLEHLQPGQFRSLRPKEVDKLRRFAQKAPDPKYLEELTARIAKLESEGPAAEFKLRDARKQLAMMRWRLGLPTEHRPLTAEDKKPWKGTVDRHAPAAAETPEADPIEAGETEADSAVETESGPARAPHTRPNRRGGQRSRFERRSPRYPGGRQDSRPEGASQGDRGDRGARPAHGSRGPRGGRGDRGERGDRSPGFERGPRGGRNDRGWRGDKRQDRGGRPPRAHDSAPAGAQEQAAPGAQSDNDPNNPFVRKGRSPRPDAGGKFGGRGRGDRGGRDGRDNREDRGGRFNRSGPGGRVGPRGERGAREGGDRGGAPRQGGYGRQGGHGGPRGYRGQRGPGGPGGRGGRREQHGQGGRESGSGGRKFDKRGKPGGQDRWPKPNLPAKPPKTEGGDGAPEYGRSKP